MPIKLQKNKNISPFATAGTLSVYLVPYWNVLFKTSPEKKPLK